MHNNRRAMLLRPKATRGAFRAATRSLTVNFIPPTPYSLLPTP
ncbi:MULTISPECIES: hypothetical protein [unclassified Moorena]|nr:MULTISPECIES: hypothetical protein [unclassified Moorena]